MGAQQVGEGRSSRHGREAAASSAPLCAQHRQQPSQARSAPRSHLCRSQPRDRPPGSSRPKQGVGYQLKGTALSRTQRNRTHRPGWREVAGAGVRALAGPREAGPVQGTPRGGQPKCTAWRGRHCSSVQGRRGAGSRMPVRRPRRERQLLSMAGQFWLLGPKDARPSEEHGNPGPRGTWLLAPCPEQVGRAWGTERPPFLLGRGRCAVDPEVASRAPRGHWWCPPAHTPGHRSPRRPLWDPAGSASQSTSEDPRAPGQLSGSPGVRPRAPAGLKPRPSPAEIRRVTPETASLSRPSPAGWETVGLSPPGWSSAMTGCTGTPASRAREPCGPHWTHTGMQSREREQPNTVSAWSSCACSPSTEREPSRPLFI